MLHESQDNAKHMLRCRGRHSKPSGCPTGPWNICFHQPLDESSSRKNLTLSYSSTRFIQAKSQTEIFHPLNPHSNNGEKRRQGRIVTIGPDIADAKNKRLEMKLPLIAGGLLRSPTPAASGSLDTEGPQRKEARKPDQRATMKRVPERKKDGESSMNKPTLLRVILRHLPPAALRPSPSGPKYWHRYIYIYI